MIELNAQREKEISFGVDISGVDIRDLNGALRFTRNGIEYGFPIQVLDNDIIVNIPPLEKILIDLTDGEKLEAVLEIVADEVFLTPWADTLHVKIPVQVQATVKEETEIISIPNLEAEILSVKKAGKRAVKVVPKI